MANLQSIPKNASAVLLAVIFAADHASVSPDLTGIENQFRELPLEARRLTGPLFRMHGDEYETPERLGYYLERVLEGGNGSRLGLWLTGGHHVCPVAILFSGNARRVGNYVTPEDMTTVLQDSLYDCDWLHMLHRVKDGTDVFLLCTSLQPGPPRHSENLRPEIQSRRPSGNLGSDAQRNPHRAVRSQVGASGHLQDSIETNHLPLLSAQGLRGIGNMEDLSAKDQRGFNPCA